MPFVCLCRRGTDNLVLDPVALSPPKWLLLQGSRSQANGMLFPGGKHRLTTKQSCFLLVSHRALEGKKGFRNRSNSSTLLRLLLFCLACSAVVALYGTWAACKYLFQPLSLPPSPGGGARAPPHNQASAMTTSRLQRNNRNNRRLVFRGRSFRRSCNPAVRHPYFLFSRPRLFS